MVTIKYHSVLNRTARISGVKSWTQAAYAIGDKPPNYPVPALIYEVEWIVIPFMSLDQCVAIVHVQYIGDRDTHETKWISANYN